MEDVFEHLLAVAAALMGGGDVEFVEFYPPVGFEFVAVEADGSAVVLGEFPADVALDLAFDFLRGIHPLQHEFDLLKGDDSGVVTMPDFVGKRADGRDVGGGGGSDVHRENSAVADERCFSLACPASWLAGLRAQVRRASV